MSLARQLAGCISACFTAVWLQSREHEDALREIARGMAAENDELPEGGDPGTVLDAAAVPRRQGAGR